MAVAGWLYARRKELGIEVLPGQRLRVSESRFRIADICVTLTEPDEEVFTGPPFVCIEILSPEDQMGHVLVKIADYLSFGVCYVWLIDPRKRRATVYTATDSYSPDDGVLRTENPAIALPLAELF